MFPKQQVERRITCYVPLSRRETLELEELERRLEKEYGGLSWIGCALFSLVSLPLSFVPSLGPFSSLLIFLHRPLSTSILSSFSLLWVQLAWPSLHPEALSL